MDKAGDLDRLFDLTLDLLCIADTHGRFLRLNKAWEGAMGYRREELEGQSFLDFVHPADLPATVEATARLASGKEVIDYVNRFRCRDGSYRRLEWRSAPYQGRLIYAVARDITDRRQAEEALQDSRQRMNDVIASAPFGAHMYRLEADGSLIFMGANRAADEFLHLDHRQFVGKPIETAFPGLVGTEIPDIYRADTILRASENRYRSFIENAPIGMYTINTLGEFTYANKKLLSFTGHCLEDWMHRSFHSLVYPEDLPLVLDKVQKRISGQGTTDPFEVRFFHASGRVLWGKIWSESVYETDAAGHHTLVGIQSFVEDITDRKAVEQALQQSEDKFRLAFESSPDAININRLDDGLYVDINQGFSTLTGFTREDVIGRTSLEINIWHNSADRERLVQCLRRRGYCENLEAPFRRKDGSLTTALMSARMLMLGGVPHILSVTRDISERKRVELALRESEEKYRNILESIEEGYFEVDLAGNLTFFNDAVCKLLGYSRDELPGMNNRQYTDEKNSKELYRIYSEVYRTGKPVKGFEWSVFRKDGTEGFGETSVSLIKDADGRPVGFRGIIRDVTNRKLAEEDKQKLLLQLQQAQKMEAIGTLAGGIAHDFNNILTVIVGCTELALLDVRDQGPLHQHLTQVRQAGTRATELVQQILAFSRQARQERRPIQPGIIVKEALKMLRASLPSTIEIQQFIQKDQGLVMADPTQIHQIMMNLCTNAAQAMRAVGGILKVSLTNSEVVTEKGQQGQELSAGRYFLLTVSDTGHGMTPEVRERIFDPYFTTKAVGEGTGMGLAVVYGIVKSHKGAVTVRSDPGKGSIFEVFLPQMDSAEEDSKKEEPGTGSQRK